MEVKILSEKENKLLKRKEVSFQVDFPAEATPDRFAVKSVLAAKLGSKPELTIIKNISNVYGISSAKGSANVYESEDALKNVEAGHLIKRNTPKKTEEPKEDGEVSE